MLKSALSGIAAAILSLAAVAAPAATPTVHQVYEAAQAGRLDEAQAMIQQVLKEHPDSAKAHYVDAELLARAGRRSAAREELDTARGLAPGLPFVKANSVGELEASIDGRTEVRLAPAHGGFPWGWVLLGFAVFAAIAFFARLVARQTATPVYPAPYQGGAPGGYVPQAAPGLGSNIVSGLATGAALGAGMVAGEELVRHFTDGGSNAAAPDGTLANGWDSDPNAMGGQDFGVADNSSWDDGSGLADMSGGDDWS